MAKVTDLNKIYKWIPEKEMWALDVEKLESRGADIYFVWGQKTLGKTYSTTEWIWHHWMKTHRCFHFARRRYDEWRVVCEDMWKDYFQERDLPYQVRRKNRFRLEIGKVGARPDASKIDEGWIPFGFTSSLDRVQETQGLHMDAYNTDTVFLDEFMIYNSQKRLIPDEVGAFQTLLKNCFRMNTTKFRCRAFCMSNSGFMTNPYFVEYDVTPGDFKDNTYVKRGGVLFVQCPPAPNKDSLDRSYTEKFKNFAIASEFLDNSDDFILPKPPRYRSGTRFQFVAEDGAEYLVAPMRDPWYAYYVRRAIQPAGASGTYTFSKLQVTDGAVYSEWCVKHIKDCIASGNLFYESPMTRNRFLAEIR